MLSYSGLVFKFVFCFLQSVISSQPVFFSDNSHLDDSCNCDYGGHIIGIAIVTVLLVVAIACIVGLVIWIVKLNKKIIQSPKQ